MRRKKYTVKTQKIGEPAKIRYEGKSILRASYLCEGYNKANKEEHGENYAWIERD